MRQSFTYLLLSIFPFFFLFYKVHEYLMHALVLKSPEFSSHFFTYISGISLMMLSNILLMRWLKPKYVGFTFLAWSMIKLMLVMAYFSFINKFEINNANIIEMLIVYLLFLVYEVFFTVILLPKRIKE